MAKLLHEKKREFIHFLCETKKTISYFIEFACSSREEMTELGLMMEFSAGLLCAIVDS